MYSKLERIKLWEVEINGNDMLGDQKECHHYKKKKVQLEGENQGMLVLLQSLLTQVHCLP